MAPPVNFTLRSANRDDAPPFFQVIDQTRRKFIIATWGRWDESRVQRESQEDCLSAKAQVIQIQNVAVGVLIVERLQTHIQLDQIYLLPEYQRLGICTVLLNKLIAEARQTHIPVRLQVIAINPAQRFYKRLGFTVTEETLDLVRMERSP